LLEEVAAYGEAFAMGTDSDGYIIAATKGSSVYTWNGFYEKISTIVDDKIFK